MTTFIIDTDNNITALAEVPATANPAETFTSEKALAKLTADWPAARLADTWNAFAGVAPFDDLKAVKRFTDRKSAVGRIWKAVQRLVPDAAPQAPDVAPEGASSTTEPTPKKKAPKPPTGAKQAKAKATRGKAKKEAGPTPAREGSKKAEVLEMMRRKNGATLAEIVEATGWQKHTVRGFVAGTLKKMGVTVESFRSDSGDRTYRVAK
ncbi:MAG: DUF3489 domain-containing protein [Bryobacteraceae bacterium]